ncbi:CHAT domain-containing protein [Microlunatus ginsengisoli]|uniref:CHAT domain-containing protein n=1 Tax=Microlunatus ginsengisoli TaxID=363863 RepID=A0ABP7A059_9ACTN
MTGAVATVVGSSDEATPAALARQALDLATVTPEPADALARRAERLANEAGDRAALSVSRRARGVAALQLRRLDLAVQQLRSAAQDGDSCGAAELAGAARMSLASALVLRGHTEDALQTIGRALEQTSGLDHARARTQRAAILQELGRLPAALDDLRIAIPALRRAGDPQWETRALSNRSLIFIARRQYAAARTDLARAQGLCTAHGLVLAGSYVEQNLGCLSAMCGDVPAALAHFDRAEAAYTELGAELGSLWLDRAKVLLGVRLIGEARAAVERAEAAFAEQGSAGELPETRLLLSTIALLDGDVAAAAAAGRRAIREFDDLGRTEWRTLAELAALQAQVVALVGPELSDLPADGTLVARLADRLRVVADDLERDGWSVPALEARVVAGRLATGLGDIPAARNDFRRTAAARRSGPAEARARAWLGEATLRESQGNTRGARSALRAGIRAVADYRRTLGATELRAHISVHRGSLARAGLRLALAAGCPRDVHWWSEIGRASADRPRPALPPRDAALARMLADLRALATELAEASAAQHVLQPLLAQQVEIEQAIRDHCREAGDGGRDAITPPTVAELTDVLADAVMVEFVELDGDVAAVTIVAGRARLHRLGPVASLVRRHLTHLPFALNRLARGTVRVGQRAAAEAVLERAALELDRALLMPLARRLGGRELVVVPNGWLHSVPWALLPSCRGRPVSVSPSAALWRSAATRQPRSSRVVAIAGPGLPGAAREARAVGELYPGSVVLAGARATAAGVSGAIGGAGLVHFATHATARRDNPLFSSLQLSDGPFTVYDLERIVDTPDHVVLAACGAAVSYVTAGEEILGLAATLLNQQTATLVAPVVVIPDAETQSVMLAYHRELGRGSPPSVALAAAQEAHRGADPATRACAASFVCLGAGSTGRIATRGSAVGSTR